MTVTVIIGIAKKGSVIIIITNTIIITTAIILINIIIMKMRIVGKNGSSHVCLSGYSTVLPATNFS